MTDTTANTQTATRAEVLDWRDTVTDPVLDAVLPRSGPRGALHPNLVKAFERTTGKTYGGPVTGKVASTVTVPFRTRNNRPAPTDVAKSEFRAAAAALGFAKADSRGRLPKGVYSDKRVLEFIASERDLKAPKGAVEVIGVSEDSDSE